MVVYESDDARVYGETEIVLRAFALLMCFFSYTA